MAKITGSYNRSKRKRSKNPTSSKTRSQRSKASSNSKSVTSTGGGTPGSAKVTQGKGGQRAKVKIKPKSTGLIGTRNTPATKTKYSGPKTPGVKFDPSKRVKPKAGGGIGASAAATAGMYFAGKLAQTIGKPGQSKMSKFGIKNKKTVASKPKMKPSPGMSKDAVAAAKKGAAAANASKPPVKASKPSKGASTPKAKSKPSVAASKPRSEGSKYKPPTKRTDKMSKVVSDLKAMQKRSKKRQGK